MLKWSTIILRVAHVFVGLVRVVKCMILSVMKSVGSLSAHSKNARTLSKRQLRLIADSIEAVGFASPIVTDETTSFW